MRNLSLVWCLVLVAGCAEDAAAPTALDAGADGSGGGAGSGGGSGDGSGSGEAAIPPCGGGYDLNGDGVCDHDVADWSRGARVADGLPRTDIYELGAALPSVASNGVGHALVWPVDVSGVLLPWGALTRMLDPDTTDPGLRALQNGARGLLGFGTTTEMYGWLGLTQLDGSSEAMPGVAWPAYAQQGDFLGVGQVPTAQGPALTFSCATCHTADLFGKTVFGLSNRRARANEFFHVAKRFFPSLTTTAFRSATDATPDELALFERTKLNLGSVGTKEPQVLGLDTSLAQVSLSLARRAEDGYSTKDRALERTPRVAALATEVADSKPAVFWNAKYKNRWLSDGSIVSGNPIYTNFLWNEIGRGTDLHELEAWLARNQKVVDELTVAVFASQAPKWVDWFGESSLDVVAAERGQLLFDANCARCHGSYEKGWQAPGAASMTVTELVRTTRVTYFEETPVHDVGTDLLRARGMADFAERLNGLEISKAMGTVVEVQAGYVPPPLEGIWARYPYLHNGSVPTLCDMLTPSARRTAVFWNGPASDPATDFDAACVGYPIGDAIPAVWKEEPRAQYDTARSGMSNMGHDSWLTKPDGSDLLTDAERLDLIAYLKTL